MGAIDVISANLPILRELHGRVGQLELAQRVGVSRRTIARLENAEVADPGVDLMSRIASELGVTISLVTESKLQAMTLALPDARLDTTEFTSETLTFLSGMIWVT